MADGTPVRRIQAPSWRDARLIVGVLLVVGATALGGRVIAAADDREPVFVAAVPLKPGDRMTEDTLRRVDVQLSDASSSYLSARDGLPAESYALRELRAGELVPLTSLGSREQVDVQPVSVRIDQVQASAITSGTVVDLYVNDRAPGNVTAYTTPRKLLAGVSVDAASKEGTGFGSTGAGAAVRVMVPRAKVQEVIAAIDADARVTLVPVPGAAIGSRS